MIFNNNALVTVTERDADGTTLYGHVFEDKGRKIIVKFNILDESRSEPTLPDEPVLQLELPPKKRNETQTKLGSQCEERSKSQSKPYTEAHPEIGGVLKPDSQPETQPDPLHEEIKHAAEEAVKIKSIRDRLGVSVTYLEGLLNIGDVVKDVSRSFQTRPPSDHKYSRRYTRSLVFPEDYCLVR